MIEINGRSVGTPTPTLPCQGSVLGLCCSFQDSPASMRQPFAGQKKQKASRILGEYSLLEVGRRRIKPVLAEANLRLLDKF